MLSVKNMTIAEASDYFGISKEAIHNRIRRGSLQSVVENGVKMVVVETKEPSQKIAPQKTPPKSERYYRYLEEQNAKLESRIDTLEEETRRLRDQKERMLIEEREKIERIYKEKDEQLKNIFTTIASQFMLNTPEEIVEVEAQPAMIEESEVISLKKYLKRQNFSQKQRAKIIKRFEKRAKKNDERILIIGSKYYLDILKYDYSDLVK
ncbi:hypothetical protein MNB_SM-5-580 [hydrothermal vent metagenome]|uniref:Uncharacterized protein n=1 Tax=hydrothermal vent metagenome TaxID=652676 RepID=A0A1W1CL75_9ZZZZ